jgi:hypothetical protein
MGGDSRYGLGTGIWICQNLVTQNIFSNGPIGQQLLAEVLPRPEVTVSYFSYFMVVYFSVFLMLIINGALIHKLFSSPHH